MSRDKSVHVIFFFHGKECLYRLYNCSYITPGQRRLLTASLLKNAKEKASEAIPRGVKDRVREQSEQELEESIFLDPHPNPVKSSVLHWRPALSRCTRAFNDRIKIRENRGL